MTISAEAAKITERCVWIEMLEAGIFSKKGWAEFINWEVEKKDRERHEKRECECFDGKCMFVKLQEAGLLDAGWSKVYLTELMRKHNEKECKCYK